MSEEPTDGLQDLDVPEAQTEDVKGGGQYQQWYNPETEKWGKYDSSNPGAKSRWVSYNESAPSGGPPRGVQGGGERG